MRGYYPLTADMGVVDAVEIFLRGVHRIAVTNNEGKITHIFTQSSLIKHLAEDHFRMGGEAEGVVGESGKGSLVTVTRDSHHRRLQADG